MNDVELDLNDDSQLFEQNPEENIWVKIFISKENVKQIFISLIFQMKHIGKGIYSRESIFSNAKSASRSASHFARRILQGVFHLNAILKGTMTGRSCQTKPKGPENSFIPLHNKAIDRIIGKYI